MWRCALHLDAAVEDGVRRIGGEAQKVLDPRAVHIHVQRDIVADAVQPSIVAGLQNAHNLARSP